MKQLMKKLDIIPNCRTKIWKVRNIFDDNNFEKSETNEIICGFASLEKRVTIIKTCTDNGSIKYIEFFRSLFRKKFNCMISKHGLLTLVDILDYFLVLAFLAYLNCFRAYCTKSKSTVITLTKN